MNKDWKYFIVFELLCMGFYFYEASMIKCEPCISGEACPPCQSDQMVIIFWMGVFGVFLFLLKKSFVWVNKKQ